MELTPHSVASATFATVRKGYDPDEVRTYLARVSTELEASQQQAVAMEARARAALAKLQESKDGDDTAVISRTLLLAQKTADSTLADAETEAARIKAEAEAAAGRTVVAARAEAQRVADEQSGRLHDEIAVLTERRDALIGDIAQLDAQLSAQRDRVRATSAALAALADEVHGGSTTASPEPAVEPAPVLPFPDGPALHADGTPVDGVEVVPHPVDALDDDLDGTDGRL
jgi:cell division initiation protein